MAVSNSLQSDAIEALLRVAAGKWNPTDQAMVKRIFSVDLAKHPRPAEMASRLVSTRKPLIDAWFQAIVDEINTVAEELDGKIAIE